MRFWIVTIGSSFLHLSISFLLFLIAAFAPMSAFTATGPVYYENIWVPFQVWNFGYEVASKTYERALPVIQPSGPKSGWTRKEQNNFYDSSKSGERVEVVLFAAWAFTIGLMVASVDYKIHTRKYNQETLRLKSLN